MIPHKPHHKGFKPSTVWNKKGTTGKGAKRSSKQNATNKARFERGGIDCCQMCGSTQGLSNSHSGNEDRRKEEALTALLCIWPCHQFLELKCSHDERRAVNEFLIETTLEGVYKAKAVFDLLPPAKAAAWAKELHLDILNI